MTTLSTQVSEMLQIMRKVEVVPHDPNWREAFKIESKRVTDALSKNVIAIHHIGSTAVPGIYAKPIIDLLIEVKDIVV
ncbi:MAG: GrpB family protein, partial [Phormidesmis sp.]